MAKSGETSFNADALTGKTLCRCVRLAGVFIACWESFRLYMRNSCGYHATAYPSTFVWCASSAASAACIYRCRVIKILGVEVQQTRCRGLNGLIGPRLTLLHIQYAINDRIGPAFVSSWQWNRFELKGFLQSNDIVLI